MSKLIIMWHYLKTLLNSTERKIREDFEHWQNKKVEAFLRKTLKKSFFYRQYYQGLEIEDWETFPCIDKKIMMDNFDLLNTVGIKKDKAFEIALSSEKSRDFSEQYGDITVGLSSGTSGNRGIFLASRAERLAWAGITLAKVLPKPIWKAQKIAFFLRANSKLYESVGSRSIQFSFFDLFDETDLHIAKLNSNPPDILVAPPSMLRILAEAKKNSLLKIHPLKIISVAETLDPLDAEYIKEQFEQIIHQVYQCTEGALGITCKHGTLHLNESHVCIQKEYLDGKSGRFIPVITDFSRITQPIIRYRLDDILLEDENACPCGSVHTAVKSIEGRMDDLFYFRSLRGEKPVPVFPDFIRRAVILSSPHIQEYMVIQHGYDRLEIVVRCEDSLWESVVRDIEKSFREFAEKMEIVAPDIAFSKEYSIEKGTKLRRVTRQFSID